MKFLRRVFGRKRSDPERAERPTWDEFRDSARAAFQFLIDDFGFREESVRQDDYVVGFASDSTRVELQGIEWGFGARVAIGSVNRPFENYDLEDLLHIRQPGLALVGADRVRKSPIGQLEQIQHYARALREAAVDVLRGDHSAFQTLAEAVERRRVELEEQMGS